jgi:predicted RNase H-like HicB family nuclease
MVYLGILDGSGDVWGVRVPDLPGVNGGGSTPAAAIEDAISAAREWIAHHTAKGIEIPAPRALDQIMLDLGDGERTVAIEV